MILVAGLTPAWQQIALHNSIELGEINRASQVYWKPSGKVLNVALGLHALCEHSQDLQVLCAVGGITGAAIRHAFERESIPTTWIETEGATRVCSTMIEQDDRGHSVRITELVENASPMSPKELHDFQNTFHQLAQQATCVVLAGSLPLGTPKDFYRGLLLKVPHDATVLLDARNEELRFCMDRLPFLVKPNKEELQQTLHCEIQSESELIDAMLRLNRRGAIYVLVTDGANRVYLTSSDEVWSFLPLQSQVVNPIGCGDSLAAGLSWSLSQGMNVIESVKVGMAAASQNVESIFPAALRKSELENLASQVEATQHDI